MFNAHVVGDRSVRLIQLNIKKAPENRNLSEQKTGSLCSTSSDQPSLKSPGGLVNLIA